MASEALESHLHGHDIVKVCLSMADELLESHLEGHDIEKVQYACPWPARHWNLTLRAMML